MSSESRERRDLTLSPIDRRTLLKIAGAATLTAPGLTMLQGLTGNSAVAQAAAGSSDAASSGAAATVTLGGADVRPPSVPLAVRSPYLSAWLPTTDLTSATPQFWNGAARGFVGLVRIDGQVYSWAGQPLINGTAAASLTQTSLQVTPTKSIFVFNRDGVELTAEWLSPIEPGDLQRASIPFSLLTVSVGATDGASHDVQVYADITGEWAASDESDLINWAPSTTAANRCWSIQLQTQKLFTEDTQMANWGTAVWGSPRAPSLTYQSGYAVTVRDQFATAGTLADTNDTNYRAITSNQPVFAFARDVGTVQLLPQSVSFAVGHIRTLLVSYGANATQMVPWWMKYWSSWPLMVDFFFADASAARTRCTALDQQIEQAATAAAGSGYAAACALALRQCYGGTELATGPDGKSPWLLGKEISSNGDTNTVDIFDQAFLAWLWLDPDLIPLVMAPILDWCASSAWQTPSGWTGIPSWEDGQNRYCVHDLGAYPAPAGRVPGEGEQMPIEESAGMLIMAAAYAKKVGAVAAEPFLKQSQLLWTQWAEYLMTQVPTPDAQLTTDDWVAAQYRTPAGSANLGIKAIIGLAAAGQIATILSDSANAARWSDAATNNVETWVTRSTDASGDYLNLEQGATGTWSTLYNAYYETVIGVSLVPGQVAADQATFYLNQLTTYGMALQTGANDVNKVAWLFYLAAWLPSYPVAAELLSRSVAYINDTPSLVPYGDRYDTSNAVEVTGIQAHPTLGAVFAILANGAVISTQAAPAPATPTATPAPPAAQASTPEQTAARTEPVVGLSIGSGGLKVSSGHVSIGVHCSGADGRGALKLVYTREVKLLHHRHKQVSTVIGHASYSLLAGRSGTVRIKLTPAGLRFLKDAKNNHLRVVVEATVIGGKSTSKHTTIHPAAASKKRGATT
jgi:hypothetical protein